MNEGRNAKVNCDGISLELSGLNVWMAIDTLQ